MSDPIDLARARRIRSAIDRLALLISGGEVDPGRTAAYLAGELSGPGGPLKEADETPLSIRLPRVTVERLDALAERLDADPTLAGLAGGRVSRSAVLRLVLVRGLAALEADTAPPSARAPLDVAGELAELRARLDALAAAVRA